MFAQLPFVSKSRTVRGVVATARLSRLWQPDPPPRHAQPPEPTPQTAPPPRRRSRLAPVAAALGALGAIMTAAVLLMDGARTPEPPPPLPLAVHHAAASPTVTATTPDTLVVSVVGKVAEPGLVTVTPGARVADALAAAGGAVAGANLATINLARKLSDGEQIYVDIPIPPGMAAGGQAASSRLDLNTATAAQLEELPGVGEVTAQRILEWRAEHGRFTSVDQLLDVSGIGDTRLADIRGRVTVSAAG